MNRWRNSPRVSVFPGKSCAFEILGDSRYLEPQPLVLTLQALGGGQNFRKICFLSGPMAMTLGLTIVDRLLNNLRVN